MQAIQNLLASQPLIDQVFLNPIGLLAILALIPLLIFYLMKPKPEEQVMPSIMFFQEEKEEDKLRKAYRTLVSNLPLLLQIFAVLFFAVALAEPFINTAETSDKKVIILDQSASVSADYSSLKDKVKSRAGETNTLITVSDSVNVRLESGSESDLKSTLSKIEPVHTETDIVSAVEVAKRYEGDLMLASDLDQTLDDRKIQPVLDEMSSRNIGTIGPEISNDWGIVDLELSRNTTSVEISNFEQNANTLQVEHNQQSREVTIAPESTKKVTFEPSRGENTIKLPEDGLKVDNEANYVIPENEEIEVRFIGDVDRYLKKAIELIEGMNTVEKESEIEGSEVYIISRNLQSSEANKLKEEVSNGALAVLMPDNNVVSSVFGYNDYGKTVNKSVEVREPVRVSLGKTRVKATNISDAKSLAGQSNAIQTINQGEGHLMMYNLVDDDFSENILYPVFWKKILRDLVDRPDVSELNRETGDTIRFSEVTSPSGETFEGRVKLDRTGFYRSDSKTYASNLESRQESSINSHSYSVNEDEVTKTNEKSLQNLSILLILIFVGIDVLYLRYRGDL